MGGSRRSSPGKCLTGNDDIELFGPSAFLKRDLEVQEFICFCIDYFGSQEKRS